MQKTKILFLCFGKTSPILARGLQQLKCSLNVGANKLLRILDGAIYVTFCRKMNDCRRLMALQQITYQFCIVDVASRKYVTAVFAKLGQVCRVSCIGELIKIHDPRTFFRQPVQYEVGADKPGAARHQNGWLWSGHVVLREEHLGGCRSY